MVGAPGYAAGKSCIFVMGSEKTSAKSLAHAYYLLEENGVLTNFAAVGGKVTLDTEGAEGDEVVQRFLADAEAQDRLSRSIIIERAFGLKGISYDAAYLPGATENQEMLTCTRAVQLLQAIASHGKVIGGCGDAIANLAPLLGASLSSDSLLSGRETVSLPNPRLQALLVDAGARTTQGRVVISGNLITAQADAGEDAAAALLHAIMSNKTELVF